MCRSNMKAPAGVAKLNLGLIKNFSEIKMHKYKGHTFNLTRITFKLDLHILVTYLYSEFRLKMSMIDRYNERKP